MEKIKKNIEQQKKNTDGKLRNKNNFPEVLGMGEGQQESQNIYFLVFPRFFLGFSIFFFVFPFFFVFQGFLDFFKGPAPKSLRIFFLLLLKKTPRGPPQRVLEY